MVERSLYPLPVVPDPDEYVSVCVRVPNEQNHRAAFLGALLNLASWFSWERDDDHTGKIAADVWKEIWVEVRDSLAGDCNLSCVSGFRYLNGRLQQQSSNGTWSNIDSVSTDTGGADYFPPPSPRPIVAGQDTACLAAANAANTIKLMHASVVNDFSDDFIGLAASTVIASLATVIFFPPSLPIVLAIIGTAASVIGTLTLSSFTDEILNDLECILNTHADVSVSNVVTFDFDAVLSEAVSRGVSSSMWAVIGYYLQIIQEGGLNLAGATTAISEANCACDVWCYTFDFTAGVQDWSIVNSSAWGAMGEYSGGAFNAASRYWSAGAYATLLHINHGLGDSTITRVLVECTGSWGVNVDFTPYIQIRMNDEEILRINKPTTIDDLEWIGERIGQDYINIQAEIGYDGFPAPSGPPGGSFSITRITLEGTGVNPFGADNCT